MTQALLFETAKPETIPVPGERGKRQALLLPRVDIMPAPSEDELCATLLWAAELAVRKRMLGAPPAGMQRRDLMAIIAENSHAVCARWRPGGPKKLREYCYFKCCMELCEFFEKRKKQQREYLDALDAPGTVGITRRMRETIRAREAGESDAE